MQMACWVSLEFWCFTARQGELYEISNAGISIAQDFLSRSLFGYLILSSRLISAGAGEVAIRRSLLQMTCWVSLRSTQPTGCTKSSLAWRSMVVSTSRYRTSI